MIGQGMHGFVGNDSVEFEIWITNWLHPPIIVDSYRRKWKKANLTVSFRLAKIDPWFLGLELKTLLRL